MKLLKLLPSLSGTRAWLIGAGLALAASRLGAVVLTSVPMQGGMVMPMIGYHSEHGHLHVMMDTNVPQLTPLLVSNPADSFAESDPWFDLLDPSRQGASFSRRYGFVMDGATDPLPPNTAIWLRKLSGSPELGFYRYAASVPKAWEPIFGTAGTSNALFWNGMMFHPGVSALPGTNALFAEFEAVLVNTITQTEIPDSGTGPFTLRWSNVPDGRPLVTAGAWMAVSWPGGTTNWVLESADTLPSAAWTAVTNAPVMVDGRPVMLLEPALSRKFYRMRRSP